MCDSFVCQVCRRTARAGGRRGRTARSWTRREACRGRRNTPKKRGRVVNPGLLRLSSSCTELARRRICSTIILTRSLVSSAIVRCSCLPSNHGVHSSVLPLPEVADMAGSAAPWGLHAGYRTETMRRWQGSGTELHPHNLMLPLFITDAAPDAK